MDKLIFSTQPTSDVSPIDGAGATIRATSMSPVNTFFNSGNSSSSNIASVTSQTAEVAGTGKAGDVNLNVQGLIRASNSSQIFTFSSGTGQSGNISLTSDRLILNRGVVTSFGNAVTGGEYHDLD